MQSALGLQGESEVAKSSLEKIEDRSSGKTVALKNDSVSFSQPVSQISRARKVAVQKMTDVGTENSEQFRVVITRFANAGLESAVTKINSGFEGGVVSRSDIANFLFTNLERLMSESDIKILRSQHFDEKKVLQSMLKSEGDLPEDVRRVLREHFGVSDSGKKRVVRVSSEAS